MGGVGVQFQEMVLVTNTPTLDRRGDVLAWKFKCCSTGYHELCVCVCVCVCVRVCVFVSCNALSRT